MDYQTVLTAVHSWFFDQGWKLLLIVIVASMVRRFGMIAIGRVIGRSINHSDRFENERDRKLRIETLKSLVSSVLKIVTWCVVIILILSEFNVLRLVAPLLAGAGILSLLVGFGIQTFIKDFISGIFIVAENQYRVGDFISAATSVGGTVEGTVIRISLRTTVLRDQDGAIHFIPNGNIARAANQTLDYAKVNIELELPIGANVQKAERLINELGLSFFRDESLHSTIVQAPYYHGIISFTKDTLVIEVRAKTIPAEQWRISSELRKQLIQLILANNTFIEKPGRAKRKNSLK